MPRKQQTTIDAVLDYFETTPLDVANLSLKLAARAIRNRERQAGLGPSKPAPAAATSAAPRAPRPRAPQAAPAAAAGTSVPAGGTTQAPPAGAPPASTTAPAV